MISIMELMSSIPVSQTLSNVKQEDINKEILRAAIISEYDAINLYEQLSARADNPRLKVLLLDIAKEEKTHVGEFEEMLRVIDREQEEESINGAEEVQEKFL